MVRVILVDDEENALDMLEILLQESGTIEVAGKFTNPLQAVEEIGRLQADAVFLDIDMPGMKGVDVARVVRSLDPDMPIVFVTAYAEYALEAFEIHSQDYLLKPIRKERLLQTVKRLENALPERHRQRASAPEIVCMGTFAVHADMPAPKPLSWRTNKEKELCAILVHHGGQFVEQAVIMEALWPDSNFGKSRSYLYTCISLLRKNLQANRLPMTLHKSESAYSLDIGTLRCDAALLDGLLERTLRGDGLGLRRLEQIADLYRGKYLGNCDFHWALHRQNELTDKYVRALRALCRHFQSAGQPEAALDCLRKIMAVSPDSEVDGRELIRLYIQTGDRNEAIKAYRQLVGKVRELLDVEPDEETVMMYRRLVVEGAREEDGA